LSKEEILIANKFIRHTDRIRYIVSHAYLRILFSQYFPSIRPHRWKFEINKYGRPEITKEYDISFYFNLSHTTSCAYILFSSNPYCGIDIEENKNIEINDGILDLTFTNAEKEFFNTISNKKSFFILFGP